MILSAQALAGSVAFAAADPTRTGVVRAVGLRRVWRIVWEVESGRHQPVEQHAAKPGKAIAITCEVACIEERPGEGVSFEPVAICNI